MALALLIGMVIWLFGPAKSAPFLADVHGSGISVERGLDHVQARTGLQLLSADTLRLGSNETVTVSFSPEKTRIELRALTELRVVRIRGGKRLELRHGQLEATVARQRPFAPLEIVTSQAEARVVGTHFTLAVGLNTTRLDVMEGRIRFKRTDGGKPLMIGAGHYAEAAPNVEFAALPVTGKILREYWTNLSNKALFPSGTVLR
jgi:hypothetical protein